MEPAASIGRKLPGFRRWRRALPALLGLPMLVVLAGNLLLSSPWSCRWIAAKISHRTGGLEVRVGGASWSPWNGASITGLELLQPAPLRAVTQEPLVRIDAVRFTPVWRAWLRGRLEVRSIELDSPRCVLPLELVSHLARAAQPTAAPPVAAIAPPPAVVQPVPPPPAALHQAPKPPPPPAPPSQPTGWLRLKNASFAVVYAGSNRGLLEIANASGAIPISGDPAQSELKIGRISAAGNVVTSDLTPTLAWSNPLLSLKPLETTIGGYRILVAAKIAGFSGLPLQIEAQLPRQPLAAVAIPFGGEAAAESIAGNLRFRGLLLAPGTWQGDLVGEAVSPTLRITDHEKKFDKGGVVVVLRGGILSCVDARLIGDDLSLLGNATLLADGRCAGVARLVAAPETVTTIASRAFPNTPSGLPLTPLATSQRAAFDLEVFGTISQPFLRLGKDGPIVNLKP